mmetsp:Transcript_16196/g.61733  ORF Transcript_16196/g.61733 Transcript_16196/m.61733 type:complete len:233 (+) Transcript_16196:241-939(+)
MRQVAVVEKQRQGENTAQRPVPFANVSSGHNDREDALHVLLATDGRDERGHVMHSRCDGFGHGFARSQNALNLRISVLLEKDGPQSGVVVPQESLQRLPRQSRVRQPYPEKRFRALQKRAIRSEALFLFVFFCFFPLVVFFLVRFRRVRLQPLPQVVGPSGDSEGILDRRHRRLCRPPAELPAHGFQRLLVFLKSRPPLVSICAVLLHCCFIGRYDPRGSCIQRSRACRIRA